MALPSSTREGRTASRGLRRAAVSEWLASYPLAGLGVTVLVLTCLVAVLAPALPLDPANLVKTSDRLLPPLTLGHVLGTDDLGRDLLSRLVWGARPSLLAGFLATAGALIPGVIVGLAAGYYLGWFDMIAMRGVEILLAFPALLLAIAIVAGLGPGLTNAMIAVAVVGVPAYARLVRGLALSLRDMEYVEAARATGASDLRIIVRHILPNAAAAVLVLASLDVGQKIVITAGLSFLGLGSQPPESDWGAMLARGRGYMAIAPHIVALPGLAIALVVLSFNFIGDALRDATDPRTR